MAADIHSREQRLRKQAERQTLYTNLANLREREASYIAASAAIPELLINQINEQRQQIKQLENELLSLDDVSIQTPAHQFYWEAFEAEQAKEFEKALKLYRNAARSAHPDAEAAQHSVRYQIRLSKIRASAPSQVWPLATPKYPRNRLRIGLLVLLILIGLIIYYAIASSQSQNTVAAEPTSTATLTPPSVILIIPDTPTPSPTIPPDTPTPTPIPATATPSAPATATPSPSPAPTLRPAPRIREPKDGLVWLDGTIVFEFERQDLAYDELYCLNTLRGYDKTLTENWSFPAVGSKSPAIPVEANVFRVAKLQGMECIVWSAAIGKGSCDTLISENTEERVIGLPRSCNFKK